MNVTRITGLLALAASFALSACGGGGAPTTAADTKENIKNQKKILQKNKER